MLTFDISVDTVITDPNNARKHDSKNLDAIKGSLAKFGQQKPIVIDENNIVLAGNGTLAAARSLGWKNITAVRTGLKGYEATAYALADNRTSELAQWDDEQLGGQLAALGELEDMDLGALGFDNLNDWSSDLGDIVDKTDSNLDGINASIKIEIPQEQKQQFTDWLSLELEGSQYDAKITG